MSTAAREVLAILPVRHAETVHVLAVDAAGPPTFSFAMTVIHLLVEILSINFEMDTLIVGSLYPDTYNLLMKQKDVMILYGDCCTFEEHEEHEGEKYQILPPQTSGDISTSDPCPTNVMKPATEHFTHNILKFGSLSNNQSIIFPKDARNIPLQDAMPSLRLLDNSLPIELTTDEAWLMRYFIDTLAPLFDVCDSNQHFGTVAPRRALENPTLLNAICATSARHLSRTGSIDSALADNFYQSCLESLIPVLDNPASLMDETLFAATVILRLFEELDEPLSDTDKQSHHLGVQVLLDAQEHSRIGSGLGRAAFQVAMRQECGMAVLHQRPVLASLYERHRDWSVTPDSDMAWGERATAYVATVLEYCYGREKKTVERWEELVDHYTQGLRLRPDDFKPFYQSASEESGAFPVILYVKPVQVLVAKQYTVARLALAMCDPRTDNSEQTESDETKCARTEEIKSLVYELCGIALSNPKSPVPLFTACGAITICRQYFVDRQEQEMLLEILVQTERKHGWSTSISQRLLRDAWII